LVDVADKDGGKDDVAERSRGGVNAGHRVRVDVLFSILDQKEGRGRTDGNLEKKDEHRHKSKKDGNFHVLFYLVLFLRFQTFDYKKL